jgi:hypothetical protein
MYYKNTTQTPNTLFNDYLKILKESELKVLLTVIHRTVGKVDTNNKKKRLERAWISQKLFMLCTGLSGRAISSAIDMLVSKKCITVTNYRNSILNSKTSRRGALKLYYSSNLLLEPKKEKKNELSSHNPITNSHTIKLSAIKLSNNNSSQGLKRLTDSERIQQILANNKSKYKKGGG